MNRFLKNCEKVFKRLIRKVVFRTQSYVTPKIVSAYSDELAKAGKILLLRQDRIGDLLISVPFMRNFKLIFPDKTIHILLSYKNFTAKSCIESYVDTVFYFPKNLFGKLLTLLSLRNVKYDLVIDLFDNPSYTSSLIINFIKPKYSLGFEKENKNVYTHIVSLPDKMKSHIIDRVCTLLVPFGINPQNIDKRLEYPLKINDFTYPNLKKKVGVVVSGSSKSKFWGLENLNSLIKLINSKYDYEIVIFATKGYEDIIKILKKNENVYIAPFSKSFDEFANMIAKCNYLITPDTSAVHLASAFQIPVVVFYTFVNEKFGMPWLPYGTKYRALISSCNNYSDISPNEVINALSQLIEV